MKIKKIKCLQFTKVCPPPGLFATYKRWIRFSGGKQYSNQTWSHVSK